MVVGGWHVMVVLSTWWAPASAAGEGGDGTDHRDGDVGATQLFRRASLLRGPHAAGKRLRVCGPGVQRTG